MQGTGRERDSDPILISTMWGRGDQGHSLAKVSRCCVAIKQTRPCQVATHGNSFCLHCIYPPRWCVAYFFLPLSRFLSATENNDLRGGTAFISTFCILREKSITVPCFACVSIFPSARRMQCLDGLSEGHPSSNSQWLLHRPIHLEMLLTFHGKVCLLTSMTA